VRRITVLTGTDDELAVTRAVEAAGVEWTHVRPSEFMANAHFWAESIRAEGVVRAPFGQQPHAMVDEADVAAVAVSALLEDGHSGQTYKPTGPEALTRADAVRTIGEAIGRDLRFVELTEEQGREQLRESGVPRAEQQLALRRRRSASRRTRCRPCPTRLRAGWRGHR
jgi:uncharacterized protein YbjT (DUF2867 family)